MNKTLAYIRVSTENQESNNQRLEILEFARKQNIKVDEFIEITVSSRKNTKDRRIDELLARLAENDTLIVTEISRLGRSTSEVIQLINRLIENNVRIMVLKQGLDISRQDMQSKIIVTLFSLFAELERDLVSLRTKEALAAKKSQGILLGKPRGTIQKSKFDADRERIEELLKLGLSVRKIAKLLNYPNHIGLNTYVKKRGVG
jgi:DNA invertase Pin-like site-specific DNA recombinase